MSKIKTFLIFVIGVATGSLSTYFLLKKKYEILAKEEIREVRELYRSNSEDNEQSESEEPSTSPTNNYEHSSLDADRHAKAFGRFSWQANINKPIPQDYTSFYKPEDVIVQEPVDVKENVEYKSPYVISPDDFGEIPSYTEMYLILHPNGAITDTESGEEIEDIEDLIGTGWDKRIGEYEMNIVRIRNERLSMDIEIEQILPNPIPVETPILISSSDVTNSGKKTTRKPHEVDPS